MYPILLFEEVIRLARKHISSLFKSFKIKRLDNSLEFERGFDAQTTEVGSSHQTDGRRKKATVTVDQISTQTCLQIKAHEQCPQFRIPHL